MFTKTTVLSALGLVSLNRLSFGCITTPGDSLGNLPAFEYYPSDLNNAATSRTLVNPAVIFILINNCKFVFLFILC